ncbi:hypothetical protein SEA_MISCHIEF19_61 [Streptomyces phage Mischief19]|nr:hypothetical protein SEA_MISCHIEF19_61 [Streptomyces phage Mischief19]
MTNTTATKVTAAELVAGTIVWGRPVREGKAQSRRKGLVLGSFGDSAVIVWWYGEGAASGSTTTMAFPRELTRDGDMFDLSARVARKLAKGCYGFERAASVGWSLTRHAARMASLGASQPVR